MVLSVRKAVRFARYAILFLLAVYALYQLLQAMSFWLQPVEKYREPEGKAVKVFLQEALADGRQPMGERLKRFYRYGE